MKKSFTTQEVFKLLSVLFILSVQPWAINAFAQQITIQKTIKPENLKSSKLRNLEYNENNKTTTLHYCDNRLNQTKYNSFTFNDKLELIHSDSETLSLSQEYSKALQAFKESNVWFNYRGNSYCEFQFVMEQGLGGKIDVMQQKVEYTYVPDLDIYLPKYYNPELVQLKGANNQKLHLYDYYIHSGTGDAIALVGIKAENGSKCKAQHARKFQVVKITKDLQITYMDEINFDYNMTISFSTIITNADSDPYDYSHDRDISGGKVVMVFAPFKPFMGKKNTAPDANTQTLLIINEFGKVDLNSSFIAPVSGWVIEDVVSSYDGANLFFHGSAAKGKYVNQLTATNSPLSGAVKTHNASWHSYQVMKVAENKIEWITANPLSAFKGKNISPKNNARRTQTFNGKNFITTMSYVTPEGELFLGGQTFNTTEIPDPDTNEEDVTIEVISEYCDLLLFHFGAQGELKQQYSVKRNHMNSYAKQELTPQYLYLSSNQNMVYWIYGEIKGQRGWVIDQNLYDLTGLGELSRQKLLFYPNIATIDLATNHLSDFTSVGTDENGQQKYYAHPALPPVFSETDNTLTFVGEDKKGTEIWIGQMKLE